jgi:DNA-directed RNA polymerase specialized sigma24 family protein
MTREEFLMIPQTERRIRTLKRSVAALRELATSLSAPLGGDRVQSSGVNDRTGRLVAEIADAEDAIIEQLRRLSTLRLEAYRLINTLPDPEQSVAYLRYIVGLTWERVAEESGYETRYCKRLGRRALDWLFPQ